MRSHDIIRNSRQVAGTTATELMPPVIKNAGAAIPPVATAAKMPNRLNPSASASVVLVPAVVQTDFFSASIATSALTVGRPKQFIMAFVTLFVETLRLIVAPMGAKLEPVEERMSFL